MARAPLPLRGFISAVGSADTKSVRSPMDENKLLRPSVRKVKAPEFRKTLMATSMATRYGMIRMATSNPPLAPSTKVSNTLTRRYMPPSRKARKIKMISPLLSTVEKVSMPPEPRDVRYQMRPAIRAEIHRTQPRMTGCSRLIRWRIDTMVSAATVAVKVAIMQGMKMSVGLAAGGLTAALIAMMLTGINVRPEACRARNMIWALDARSFSGLSSWRLCMAFSPKGVAALSRPSRLAEKFIIICPMAG